MSLSQVKSNDAGHKRVQRKGPTTVRQRTRHWDVPLLSTTWWTHSPLHLLVWNKMTPLYQEDTYWSPRLRTPTDDANYIDPAHVVVADPEMMAADDRQNRQNARLLQAHTQVEEGTRQETAADKKRQQTSEVQTCWTKRTQCLRTA